MKPDMSNELRGMVREVLRDVMASRAPSGIETVRMADDRDLAVFVARIIEPATLERVKSGRLRFTLGGTTAPTASPSGDTVSGVITEKTIGGLVAGATLVLGAGAVLTPLARDKARQLAIKIERRR